VRKSNMYTITFAALICVICSLLISLAATSLKSLQDRNVAIDIQKNILRAVGLPQDPTTQLTSKMVGDLYQSNIKAIVVSPNGKVIEGKTPQDLISERNKIDLGLYLRVNPDQPEEVLAYAFPIQGMGLWSTLYGYLALKPDLNTVAGITFYKHGETPGLGAEIETDWFTANFVGKKILDTEGNMVSITVIKGSVSTRVRDPEKATHAVDGISGATVTSNGVTNLLKKALNAYEPYFKTIRPKGNSAWL